ncbi:MAG: hypothetical protein IPH72_17960 [Sandaracinaceae bacterium]|nr:hypothetical protein [Sandaracinaceae bacterium]
METLMGNDAQRQGAAPHTCPARGAVATTEECRFLSFLADNPSQAVPGVGLCLDPTQQSYDHDQGRRDRLSSLAELLDADSGDLDGNGIRHGLLGAARSVTLRRRSRSAVVLCAPHG